MSDLLYHHSPTLVEYLGYYCTEHASHPRMHIAVQKGDLPYISEEFQAIVPESCSECGGDVSSAYTFVSWPAGEQVSVDNAIEMMEATHGYMALKFNRENYSSTPFTRANFENEDTPLLVVWNQNSPFIAEVDASTPYLKVDEDILYHLLSYFPVEAISISETPFEESYQSDYRPGVELPENTL